MKLFRKLGGKEDAHAPAKIVSRPTAVDILRYRYHNGTNLGSIYVLEKWLTPSMFEHTTGSAELDAVRGSLQAIGLPATINKWQTHWASAIKPEEWAWLRQKAHCTTIRLPIGYWTLGPRFTARTPFGDADITKVYEHAWRSVTHLVKTAASQGIGILLDLHGLPGGANKSPHSGTSQQRADFWGSAEYRKLARDCVVFIAQEAVADHAFGASLVGIQIVNEATGERAKIWEWYESVLGAVANVDSSIPIYISDIWDVYNAVRLVKERVKRSVKGNPVVIDSHEYFCFGGKSKESPFDIIENWVPWFLRDEDHYKPSKGVSVIVGEWSCVLGEESWAKAPKDQRGPLTKKLGLQQSKVHYQRAGGSLFWNWKMDWMPGGGWGYTKQTNDGNLFIPPVLLMSPSDRASRIAVANSKREEKFDSFKIKPGSLLKGRGVGSRVQGWEDGWEDSVVFFANGDVIGLLGAWIVKRMQEDEGRGRDWADGFQAGTEAFKEVVGV